MESDWKSCRRDRLDRVFRRSLCRIRSDLSPNSVSWHGVGVSHPCCMEAPSLPAKPRESAEIDGSARKSALEPLPGVNQLNEQEKSGCPARIRTSIDGVRVRSLTIRRRGNRKAREIGKGRRRVKAPFDLYDGESSRGKPVPMNTEIANEANALASDRLPKCAWVPAIAGMTHLHSCREILAR